MRITTAVAVASLLVPLHQASLAAQDAELPARSSHFSLGLGFMQLRDEPGWGMSVTSPYLINSRVALRLSLGRTELQGVRLNSFTFSGMPYTTFKAGIVAVGGAAAGVIRAYAQGGIAVIRPHRDFSEDDVLGGYLGFGFEFFWGRGDGTRVSSFLELGGLAADAVAEKLPGEPVYATGADLSVGVRLYL